MKPTPVKTGGGILALIPSMIMINATIISAISNMFFIFYYLISV